MTLSEFMKKMRDEGAEEEYKKRIPVYGITAEIVETFIKGYLELLCKTRSEEYSKVFDRNEYDPRSKASVPLVYSRSKPFDSVCEKVYFDEVDKDRIYEQLPDLGAVRVTCQYLSQVYYLYEKMVLGHLAQKCRIEVEKDQIRDYMKNPKKSGYRSLQMALLVPSFDIHNSEKVRCELQIRTDIQHAWAEKEHQLIYKNRRFKKLQQDDPKATSEILEMSCAAMGILHSVDEQLQAIRNMVKRVTKDIHV